MVFGSIHQRKYQYSISRSSHQRCSIIKGFLRNFTKFTGKHLCQGLFYNKVAGLKPATLLKTKLWYRCFPVNFAKFRRIYLLQNTSGRLLLHPLEDLTSFREYTNASHFSTIVSQKPRNKKVHAELWQKMKIGLRNAGNLT